jgi:hypothetical protein
MAVDRLAAVSAQEHLLAMLDGTPRGSAWRTGPMAPARSATNPSPRVGSGPGLGDLCRSFVIRRSDRAARR